MRCHKAILSSSIEYCTEESVRQSLNKTAIKMKNYDILKRLCRIIYLTGAGDFWFDKRKIGNNESFLYIFYGVSLYILYLFLTIMEVLAAVWGELPKDEKNDSITLAVTHIVVVTKMFIVLSNRDVVKDVNRKMVEVCQDHEDEDRVAKNYRVMMMNLGAYTMTVFLSIAGFVLEGIRKKLAGSHFITAVTYWPLYDDDSIPAVSFRVFTTILLFNLLVSMIALDAIVIVTLIMYKYKFITLRRYFEDLRVQFDENHCVGNEKHAADQLYNGLIDGVVMHRSLLRLSKDIDRAYGSVLALQVFESFGSAVSLLLQLALTKDLAFSGAIKLFFFLIAIYILLSLFMCNAGEITYQASLLSDSLFYCGWHATPMRRDLRQLVLLTSASAQRPVVMKAFKMLELTYGTFIQVVRSTYSVFAVFYAQNKKVNN